MSKLDEILNLVNAKLAEEVTPEILDEVIQEAKISGRYTAQDFQLPPGDQWLRLPHPSTMKLCESCGHSRTRRHDLIPDSYGFHPDGLMVVLGGPVVRHDSTGEYVHCLDCGAYRRAEGEEDWKPLPPDYEHTKVAAKLLGNDPGGDDCKYSGDVPEPVRRLVDMLKKAGHDPRITAIPLPPTNGMETLTDMLFRSALRAARRAGKLIQRRYRLNANEKEVSYPVLENCLPTSQCRHVNVKRILALPDALGSNEHGLFHVKRMWVESPDAPDEICFDCLAMRREGEIEWIPCPPDLESRKKLL